MTIDARILERPDQVLDLREEWEHLYRRSGAPHLFLAPAWVLNWRAAFGPADTDIRVFTVWRGGRLAGIAPCRVTTERHWGREVATLRLWADVNANRTGVLIDPDGASEVLGAMARSLAEDPGWTLAALDPLPLDAPPTRAWVEALERHGMRVGLEPGFTSPYMTLPEVRTSPLDTVSTSFRRNLKRKLNRAEREGCAVIRPPAEEAAAMAFAISRESWQHANGTGLDTAPESAAFFEGMVRDRELRARLRIPILTREGEPVAYEWNLLEGRRLYNLKVGYRPAEGRLSPGLVLRHHTVSDAMAEGLEEFDFLGSVEPYKMHWATGTRRHGTLFVFRRGVRARAIHTLLYRARPALKQSAWTTRAARALKGSTPG
jgi:CelD/BcsL family acetyltransferase involved in cellulose biosynthesis